jgi:hypothetical protein
MRATIVREKRQTTLPQDICVAAGIRIHDRLEWRYKDGEIHARKMRKGSATVRRVKPKKFKDLLILPQNLQVDLEQLTTDMREEREERDERLLG